MDKNVVCLVVDRLRAAAVGAYGAAWCETPALDRLAAQSFLLDFALIDSPQLEAAYRGLWQGLHALAPDDRGDRLPSLPEAARRDGMRTVLLTDEPAVAAHTLAGGFEELLELESSTAAKTAQNIEDTQLGRFFASALGCLEEMAEEGPTLLWLHSQGPDAPWDAPLDFRNRLIDEEDPLPPAATEVPNRKLPADYDPDELLGITYAYSGQILLFDRCLEALFDHLQQSGWADNTLFVLVGARGFPLGEHLRVGPVDEPLYEETLHVPLMLRFPDGMGRAARSSALVQPADLAATIAAWLDWEESFSPDGGGRSLLPLVEQQTESLRDRICAGGLAGERAIRTPAWHLRRDGRSAKPELYVKPDDRWEVNEVADRCHEITAGLQAALAQFEEALLAGTADSLPPLDEILVTPPT